VKNSFKDIKIKTEELSGGENKNSDRNEKLEEYLSETNSASHDPVFIATEGQYRPGGLMKFLNYAGKALIIVFLGGLGGVWMEHNIIPVLATRAPFDRYEFFKTIKDRTTIINRTEEIKITEDSAALDMIRKTNPSVVKIAASYNFQERLAAGKKKAVLAETTETRNLNGMIITSDGLIMTYDPGVFATDQNKFDFKSAAYSVNYGDKEFIVSGASDIKTYDFQTKPGDPRLKFVLLKIKAANLPVAALASPNNIEVGQKVFALGNSLFSGLVSEIKNEDGFRSISVDNAPSSDYFGSGPLVNLRGEVLGINMIDASGNPTAKFISIDSLKTFINSVIGI
jgi:S1-C subfamily serine protease